MVEVVNPFKPSVDTYKRDINPVKDYVEQAAAFLHTSTGKSTEECVNFVIKALRDKKTFPNVRDPKVNYLKRQDNLDRERADCTLTQYIKGVLDDKEILAPTMTTYLNPNVVKSTLVDFIDDNVKLRGKAKKAMFAFRAAGDEEGEFFANGDQRNTKLSNNAISGAHATPSNPLYNQTSHSTLTSNCRMTSGYGNANNEKLLCGNRHYWNPDIVINNIISITTHTDYDLLQSVVEKYQLYLPSAQDVMDCVQYSSDLYWTNPTKLLFIKDYVRKLSPIERAAFLYTSDLYHIRKHNDAMMRQFLGELSMRPKDAYDGPLEFAEGSNKLKQLSSINEDYVMLAHQICANEMKGQGNDYHRMVFSRNMEKELRIVIATAQNIEATILKYADFIRAVMVTDNVPASLSYFPSSIRRAALTSDTDSTIFTVQDWVEWKQGAITFEPEAVSIAATMIFIASQAIIHILARMSKNAGIEDERLYQIAMKNEYFFPVFIPTSVAKHYFAIMSCQEGNVFDKIKTEIKGVHLKSSNAPKEITKKAADMMLDIMTRVAAGEKLLLRDLLVQVANIEREVSKSIYSGDSKYFRLGEIKSPDSYRNEKERSPYIHHMLWEEVFGPKYGIYGEPPYSVIKVATELTSPTLFKEWLSQIKDKEFADRLLNFMNKYGKVQLPTLYIPTQAVAIHGLPEELRSAIHVRKIVADICNVFYIVLETCGYYLMNKHMTHLVSDYY